MDIENMSERELVELNRRIVERLKLLEKAQVNGDMMRFSQGDRVAFEPESGVFVKGVLVKFNTKTVRILTDEGDTWNVAPRFLRRLNKPGLERKKGKVIPMPSQ
ncbi:MAG: hypothetical protein JKY01_10295 [Pseudomonadales bacterium]|nr:hypothetical protein [Pseudomonadales bacterium]